MSALRASPRLALAALGLGCAAPPALSDAPGAVAPKPPGALPSSHAECSAAGGELEAESRGGRCFFYTTPRKDPSAYIHCRESGGVMRAAGRGMAREATGQSHVCTLVFEPQD